MVRMVIAMAMATGCCRHMPSALAPSLQALYARPGDFQSGVRRPFVRVHDASAGAFVDPARPYGGS